MPEVNDVAKTTNLPSGTSISELKFTENKNSLPPVSIREDGDFTFSRNSFNRNISSHKDSTGATTSSSVSQSGLSVILKQNPNKRDVIVFSNMSDKVPNNSSIPNVYFHVEGKGQSKMYFDDNHNLVIDLKNKEKVVIDGKDGQTILSGPFKLNFNPNETGKNFKVNYNGSSNLQKFNSLGDHIKW